MNPTVARQEKTRWRRKPLRDKNIGQKGNDKEPVVAVTTRTGEKQRRDEMSIARVRVNPGRKGSRENGGKRRREGLATLSLAIPRLELIKEQRADNELTSLLNRVQTGGGD